MKAIRISEFGEPEVMRIKDVSLPAPGSEEVLIEVKAAGVNPVDTYIRAGLYGSRELPFTPGMDAAGIVRQVGKDVKDIVAGQRVFTFGSVSGTYAAQCLCRAPQIHRLPDNVSFAQGAALGVPYGTAYRALFQRAKAESGQTVLIHGGSGGVGLAAIQLAKNANLKIATTAGTEDGRQLILEQGADLALDHHDPNHFQQVLDFTDGAGVDILLEMLANVNLGRDLMVMAKHGRVVVIGSRGAVEIDPRELMSRESVVMGMMLLITSESDKAQAYAVIEKGLADEMLCPVIAQELPLKEAPKAHHAIMESAHHGNIVLIP
jgi:NADPH2:quinone reductase